MPKKTKERSAEETPRTSGKEITEEQMDEIIARARQTMKQRISKDAANEIVSDDLLNFRMKAPFWRMTRIE
jgi:hypothetical protein